MFAEAPPKAKRCRVLQHARRSRRLRWTSNEIFAPRSQASLKMATARGDRFLTPAIAIRSGDTPGSERARFQREPADILITTPESLYLLLHVETLRKRFDPSIP